MKAGSQPLPFRPCASWPRLVLMLAVLLACPQPRAENRLCLSSARRAKLARLVQADADAANLFTKLKREADASLHDQPHPIGQLATAGTFASDPAKVESRSALEDMKKLEALGFVYAVTTNAAYAAAAQRMILGWAQTYEPSGSPIDETKLEPLFVAYGLVGQTFPAEAEKVVDTWLRSIAGRQLGAVRPGSVTASNNWNSHRLKIVGLIGFLLEDRPLIDQAMSGFRKQVQDNLRPDGTSLDFHERDALHYHCYDLEPLLTLAIVARQHGLECYDYEAPGGASLRKAVNFLVPYCQGASTHAEWVNSKVAFDHQRAAAGETRFQVGAKFNPRDGLRVLELASFFDPGLKPLVSKLANRRGTSYPTPQCLLNEAQRVEPVHSE